MMRLAIAPKSTERNQRKTPQIAKSIIGLKIPPKITKMKKNITAQDRRRLSPNIWMD
jgi:hypothetical protein